MYRYTSTTSWDNRNDLHSHHYIYTITMEPPPGPPSGHPWAHCKTKVSCSWLKWQAFCTPMNEARMNWSDQCTNHNNGQVDRQPHACWQEPNHWSLWQANYYSSFYTNVSLQSLSRVSVHLGQKHEVSMGIIHVLIIGHYGMTIT